MKHFVEKCRIAKGWFEKLEQVNNIEIRIYKVRNDELDEIKRKSDKKVKRKEN